MQQPVWKRLLWLAIIWGGSVLALAAVSMFFRMLMTAAGFKSHCSCPGQPLRCPVFFPHFQINPINARQRIVKLVNDSQYL